MDSLYAESAEFEEEVHFTDLDDPAAEPDQVDVGVVEVVNNPNPEEPDANDAPNDAQPTDIEVDAAVADPAPIENTDDPEPVVADSTELAVELRCNLTIPV